MTKPIDIRSTRKKSADKKYAGAVLDAFDRLKHEEKREALELKSETERAARNRL